MGRGGDRNRATSHASANGGGNGNRNDSRDPAYSLISSGPPRSGSSASERQPLIPPTQTPSYAYDPTHTASTSGHQRQATLIRSAVGNSAISSTNTAAATSVTANESEGPHAAWTPHLSDAQSSPPTSLTPSHQATGTNTATTLPNAVDSEYSPSNLSTNNGALAIIANSIDATQNIAGDASQPYNTKCAIFWDFENCAPPNSVPGFFVVDSIRRAISQFGSIVQFRTYFEINENTSVNMRSELQSSGVSIIDTPHNARKDAADKMIMVDMLSFAMDHPPPATIVLISGDRDFVYALAVLRNRRYNVVLVVPNKGATPVLRSQANVVLEWRYDILSQNVVAKFQTPPPRISALARSTSQMLAAGGNIELMLASHGASSGQHVPNSTPHHPGMHSHLATISGSPVAPLSSGLVRSQSHSHLQTRVSAQFDQPTSIPKSTSSSYLRVQVASGVGETDTNCNSAQEDGAETSAGTDLLDEVPVYSPTAPGFFDVLVEILKASRSVGINKPLKSRVVAELLTRNPMLCQRAGISTIDDFLETAVAANLIRIGGIGPSNQWVTLNI